MPMELRLYRLVCLIAWVASFFLVLPINYLQQISPYVNYVVAIYGAFNVFLYLASLRGRYYTKIFFIALLLALNATWFFNGGSKGGVSYYFFAAFFYSVIFYRGMERWAMVGASILNCLCLVASEAYFPNLLVPFVNDLAQRTDIASGIVISGLVCTTMLMVVLTEYDREHQRLRTLYDQLQLTVAERKLAENQASKAQQRLDAVVAGTPDPIYVKDLEGSYLLVNEAAANLMGVEEAGILGKGDRELSPEAAEFFSQGDQIAVRRGSTVTFQNHLTLPGGERRSYLTTKGVLRDDGEVTGLFGISRDVSELDEVTDQVRRLNEELDHRVRERTEQLERAIREQEAFSYSVSHDLRSPLRHINSYTTILKEEAAGRLVPDEKKYLDQICRATRHMGRLIDDLLELSRVSRSQVALEPVNLSNLAILSSLMLRQSDNERIAEFEIDPGMIALGDKTLLTLVIDNLFGNAWKYTSRKEKARIRFGREMVEGKEVFFVKDNGTGFDMAYRHKLFGPFERLHGGDYEGTGIGLATVKRIIERHQGDIWAEGIPGVGASFYFTLADRDQATTRSLS
ncbi:ATP-binding protein [Geomesophilobacter sediminis]|uniref:histidine kinase n=1 Tax=Geomesophilobacter sediminis TaxID=2798584 RepID=A0A8J7JBV9_9BACT|nr:ATP-binding protein [Geomesophilobacter sediminis]MBJ6724118.1 PAS domain-containing protein [Geomesophilobacter sediminis]